VETAGTFDLDAELKIWLSGSPAAIMKQFGKGVDVYEVQALLSFFVARCWYSYDRTGTSAWSQGLPT
jgi:hypothetical protein